MRNLPNGYQEVERIGGTNFSNYVEQVYIDTGITTSNNIGAWTEMLHTATRDNVQWFTNTLPDNTVRRGLTTYPSGKWCPQWETWRQTDIAYNTDQFYDIKLNWNNNKECVIDGTTIYNCTNTTFSSNNTIRIGDISYNGYGWKCKFFKISDGITLVRDFVPCYRIADGVIGMYDLVNDVFYINPGTGTLIKGPDVLPPKKYIDRYYLNGEMYAIKFGGGGGGRQPGANTIAYYPFTNDTIDVVGNTTCPLTGTKQTIGYSFTASGDATISNTSTVNFISVWFNAISLGSQTQIPNTAIGSMAYSFTHPSSSYSKRFTYNSNDSRPTSNQINISTNTWTHFAYGYDGTKAIAYINGSKVWEYTGGHGDRSNVFFLSDCTAIMSNLIMESVVRTAQEIEVYFNQTKSLYGIS